MSNLDVPLSAFEHPAKVPSSLVVTMSLKQAQILTGCCQKNRPIPPLLDETLRPRMGHHRLLHSICCGRDIARPVPVVPHPAPLDSGQEGDVLAAAAAKHLPCQLCAAPAWRALHILPAFSHAQARQAEDRGQGQRIRDFCCRPGHHRLRHHQGSLDLEVARDLGPGQC